MSINAGEIKTGVADCRGIDYRGKFWHMLEAKFVERGCIVILQMRQVDVLFETIALGTKLH